jgi:hypothetical protein
VYQRIQFLVAADGPSGWIIYAGSKCITHYPSTMMGKTEILLKIFSFNMFNKASYQNENNLFRFVSKDKKLSYFS